MSHVPKTFHDPHKIFCHPYYYANELPVFPAMSSVIVVELVSNDMYMYILEYAMINFLSTITSVEVAQSVSAMPGSSGCVSVG